MAPFFIDSNVAGGYHPRMQDWQDPENKWTTVFVAQGMAQASIVTGRLETEEIPVKLKYEAAGRIYALTVDGLGEVRVQVPAELLDKARRVLMDIYRDDEIPWES